MPRVPNTTRAVLAGTLPNGEIFQTGFWMTGKNVSNENDANILAGEVADAWEASGLSYFKAYLPTNAAYTEVLIYHYTTVSGAAAYQGRSAIVGGAGSGSGNQGLPLQTCIVLTLLTGFSGRRRRGRMYFPLVYGQLPAHQLPQAAIDQFVLLLGQFFSSLNAGAGQVVVHSQVSPATTSTVTAVSCDSETDVQRRRANRQVELFQAQQAVTNS